MKKKLLLITYIPRENSSLTQQLVDQLLVSVKNSDIEVIDLLNNIPDLFTKERLQSYWKREYDNLPLTKEESKNLMGMEKLARQVLIYDIIVLAYPMYNYSFPAIVKAYFDAIMFRNITWKKTDGKHTGLLSNKKAIVLTVSGGYNIGTDREHSISLAKTEFGFLGIDNFEAVVAEGVNRDSDKRTVIMEKAKNEVNDLATRWNL